MTPVQPTLQLQDDKLDEAIRALRADLLAEGGPRINTMRNHAFAILPYQPEQEFTLRRRMNQVIVELRADGWAVLLLDMHRLLLDRVAAHGDEFRQAVVERERRLFSRDPGRALDYLTDTLVDLIEGPEGLATDVAAQISKFADAHPDNKDRTLVFLGRLGALYPFARSSALLKHIAGRTLGIPVVLLYPGVRTDTTALSFMGELPPDRDYRPRIYP